MNPRRLVVLATVVLAPAILALPASATELACGTAAVRSEVEIATGELALSDLLGPGACPAMLLAARRVRLGKAPLAGSVRVFDGNQVRAFIRKMEGAEFSGSWNVPPRITVRRVGNRDSCADLANQILATLPSPTDDARPVRTMDCGAAGRIPQEAPLELSKAVWNPGLASFEISARCKHPADCVPFLVRVREERSPGTPKSAPRASTVSIAAVIASSPSRAVGASQLADQRPLVHSGQTATLVWDQDGIRLLVPVLCLDPGGPGQPVRARILRGGRVIHAIVVSAGRLRAVS